MTDNQVRPFADFLRELQKGEVHDELSQGLHQLIGRVKEIGKAGSMQLTLKVKRDRTGMVVIDDDVKVKLPDWERTPTLWYIDNAGNLTKNDPAQLSFQGIKAVDAPAEGADAADNGAAAPKAVNQ